MATNGERVENRDQVIRLLEDAFRQIDSEDLLARLNTVGIPAGKVRTIDEVYTWDQAISQGLLVGVEHATLGRLSLPGPPLRFFAPGPYRRDGDDPPRPRRPADAGPTATRSGRGCPATDPPVSAPSQDRPARVRRPHAARPGARPRVVAVVGLPDRRAGRPGVRGGAGRRRGEDPPGRGDHHRRGAAARTARGRGGRRVRLPRRIDRRRGRRAADLRGGTGHRGGPAAAGGAGLRWHPDAGGHGRLPPDDRDHGGDRPAQGGRAAVPGLPAQPDLRRRARLVGVARARDHRRARRLDRLPRPPCVRGALRREVPRGRADRRAPGRARPDRRRRRPRGDRRRRRPGAARAGRAATWHVDVRGAERPTAEDGTDADDPEDGRSAWDVVTASRRTDRPGVRRLLRTAATDVVGLSGTGAGRRTPGCCWRWPASAGPPAWCSARTGAASRCPRRSAPRRCARPGAACTWPRSCGCRWSR